MQKILILLLSALSLSVFAQEKQVAILEPIAITKEVSAMQRSMVRGEMVKAIGRQSGYAAFTRTDIDQIMAEQNFQQSGMVDDATRKRLGAMQGVDYVCVTKITKEGRSFYLEASLVNIETGKISNPATAYGELDGDGYSQMYEACEKLAAKLVERKVQTPSSSTYTKLAGNSSSTSSTPHKSYTLPQNTSISSKRWAHYDSNEIMEYLIHKEHGVNEVTEQMLKKLQDKIMFISQQVAQELHIEYVFDENTLLYIGNDAQDITSIVKNRL